MDTVQYTSFHYKTCQWCGKIHIEICPRVKAIEYHPGGGIKRVEFHDHDESAKRATWTGPEWRAAHDIDSDG